MMKCFLLLTWQSEEHSSDGVFAIVAIDDAEAKEILARKELFQMMKTRDAKLTELVFVNSRCYFFDQNAGDEIEEYLGGEQEMESFIDDGVRKVDEHLAPFDEYVTPTEGDELVIMEDGFLWRANSPHGNERFETRLIAFEDILKV